MSIVNLPTWANTTLSILTALFFLRRADCLPSSLDLKAEERKYVSYVLKANGYIKLIPSQGSPIVSRIKILKTGF